MNMNPWVPDNNPVQARRVGKTLEELGELTAVLARISIQGMDEVDPSSGKTNRVRLEEEIADVLAQLNLNVNAFLLDQVAISIRVEKKIAWMLNWDDQLRSKE